MSGKIEDVVKRLRERAEARRRSGKLLQIDDRMFDLIADEIAEAAKALEADRDNWRRQALDEDARANATCDKSSQVSNAAAMCEALEGVRDWLVVHNAYVDTEREIVKLNAALSKPPRNIDRINNYSDMVDAWNNYIRTYHGTLDGFFVWLFDKAKGAAT